MASAPSPLEPLPTSPSLPSDLYLTPELLTTACHNAAERIQLVADLLLLQSNTSSYQPSTSMRPWPAALEPVSQGNESYSKSRDSIVANTKGLAISIKELTQGLHRRSLGGVYRTMESLTEQVIVLTEAAAQAAYSTALVDRQCTPAKPGVVDRYSFERAKQAIHMSYDMFKPEGMGLMTRDQMLQVSKTFANNIAVLTQGCRLASENKMVRDSDRSQFSNLVVCLQGTTSAFLASLKLLATSHTQENRRRCLLFGKPLLAAVDSTIEFVNFPQFIGRAAVLSERGYESQTEILGAAMAIVGSSVQLLETTADILDSADSALWQKMVNCSKAVADSTKLLSGTIRDHTPMPSRRPSVN